MKSTKVMIAKTIRKLARQCRRMSQAFQAVAKDLQGACNDLPIPGSEADRQHARAVGLGLTKHIGEDVWLCGPNEMIDGWYVVGVSDVEPEDAATLVEVLRCSD